MRARNVLKDPGSVEFQWSHLGGGGKMAAWGRCIVGFYFLGRLRVRPSTENRQQRRLEVVPWLWCEV